MRDSLLVVIDKRLSVYESNRTAAKSTILDPRFKKKAFGTESNAKNAIKLVIEELAQWHVQLQPARTLPVPSTSQVAADDDDELWQFVNSKFSESATQQTPISSASVVLKQYLDLNNLDRKQDPLQFWEERKNIFPSLYKLALKYLCIPATSVPS